MSDSKIYNFKTNERADFSDFNCHWCRSASVFNHSHEDYYEISIVTEGETVNKVNNENFKQGVGDAILIKPQIYHSMKSDDDKLSVHYNVAVRKRYFENFIQNKPYIQTLLNNNEALFIHLDDESFRYLQTVISRIDNEKYDSLSCTLVETALHVIISRIMLNEQNHERCTSEIARYCYDAISKITNYSYITMQASEIYGLYPVSHSSFISEFKKITGKTLVSFLQSKKLDYSKTLLTTTNYSVLEIASILNYDSISYFIKIFKKEYSLTPYQYRKNNVGSVFGFQE